MDSDKDTFLLTYLENNARISNAEDKKKVFHLNSDGRIDQDVYYVLRENVIEVIERGHVSESFELSPDVIWPVSCVFLKNMCIYELNTKITKQFYELGNGQKKFVELMRKHADSRFYSISELRRGCINIKAGAEPDTFSVFYIYENGKRYYIQRNDKTPLCFGVFYNFTSLLHWVTEAIEEYERMAGEKLSDECKEIIIDICALYREDKYKTKQKPQ